MPVSVVQSKEGTWVKSGVAFTTSFDSTPTSGNTMCAVLFAGDNGHAVIDTTGWTQLTTLQLASLERISIWTKVAGAAEPTGVHVPIAGSGDICSRALHLYEVSGIVDVHGTATDSSPTTITGPTLTPSAAGLIIAGIIGRNQTYVGTATITGTAPLVGDWAAAKDTPGRTHRWSGHHSTTSGSYTPTATVSGPALTNTAGVAAVAFVAGGGAAPVANFTGTPLTGTATLAVTFTDTSTNTPTSWAWTFGDGGTSTSQNPSHNYTAAGTYNVQLTATNASGSDVLLRTGYVVVTEPADPGGGFAWDGDVFENERIREWTITRGMAPELTGTSNAGSATIILVNAPDDRYNPENTGGDLFGLLVDGVRVWVGVNEDGTLTADPGKDVYGLFAGRITDISVLPEPGASVAPFVELVCEDQLAWYGRQKVRLNDSTVRSQAELRQDVLDALGEVNPDLPVEPTTIPLSRADGYALNILETINQSNGTRHYHKPQSDSVTWSRYTAIRRTSLLDGTSDASLDLADQHVTSTSGWRRSADGIVNQQKASVEEISFPAFIEVWKLDTLPLTVTDETVFFADFGDYVDQAAVDYDYTGTAPTVTLTTFGDSAKVVLDSSGTTVFTRFVIKGYQVQRGSVASVVIDDETSQAEARGIRSGPDLTNEYLGTLTSAKGFAEHIVWRFGNPLYRPTLTVANWFPEMFALDIGSRIDVTSSQLGVSARIFEVVGLTHHGVHAADDGAGNPTAVFHEVTYVLQESRVQTPKAWFILDSSLLDGDDVLAY